MIFRKFEENDVGLFSQIFKKAFDKDSQIHLGMDGGSPNYENGGFLKEWFLHIGANAYAVLKDGKPIGGANVFINNQTHENILGNIFVDPDLQDNGLGLIIWKYIEQKFPETKVWRTETPGVSYRNHHFYVNKCGFKIYKIENPKDRRQKRIKLFNGKDDEYIGDNKWNSLQVVLKQIYTKIMVWL